MSSLYFCMCEDVPILDGKQWLDIEQSVGREFWPLSSQGVFWELSG